MTHRLKWDQYGGWLSDGAWKDLFGEHGPFDAKVLATVAWAASDRRDESWGDDEFTDHCTYELSCSSEDYHSAIQRLVEGKALPAAMLLEYEDERVALQDVADGVREFLESGEAEFRLAEAVGLRQAHSDYVALLKIFEIENHIPTARFAPDQDPETMVFSDDLIAPDSPATPANNKNASDSADALKDRKAPRITSKDELDDVVAFWKSLPRGSGYHDEASLLRFLSIFTPNQIKEAMRIAKSKSHPSYFKYLCGILHNWRREIESGETPSSFTPEFS